MKASPAQLVWRGFEGTSLPGWLASEIASGRCSGVVLFSRNVEHPRQTWELCRALNEARTPIAVAVDQEGGRVARLREPHFTRFPPARTMASHGTSDRLEALGRAMGLEMRAVGINLDFAPVVDVEDSLAGVIGDRSFGGDPEEAAHLAMSWLAGLQSTGVVGCVKHYPGHGGASCDSHVDLPTVGGDEARLAQTHLAPFRTAVRRGVRAIMAGHLIVPWVDPHWPASMSPALLREMLRSDMGYAGIIVSDDLEMGAILGKATVGEAAVRCVAAGCDAVLVCTSRERQEQAVSALCREAETTEAFGRMVERSTARIEKLLAGLEPPPEEFDPARLRSEAILGLVGPSQG